MSFRIGLDFSRLGKLVGNAFIESIKGAVIQCTQPIVSGNHRLGLPAGAMFAVEYSEFRQRWLTKCRKSLPSCFATSTEDDFPPSDDLLTSVRFRPYDDGDLMFADPFFGQPATFEDDTFVRAAS